MSDQKYKANKPDEILDLVNERDEVVGEVLRSDANSNPKLIHREVGILLVDNNKKILWQKRSKYKTVNPNVWSIVAGHILKGDDPKLTAHRELEEELGFDTKLIYLDKLLKKMPHETHFMYYYLGNYNNEVFKLEKSEVEEVKFFSKKELQQLESAGEKINLSHSPICEKIWSGEIAYE